MELYGYGFEFDAGKLQRKIENFIGTHKEFFVNSEDEVKIKMFNQATLREYTPFSLNRIFKEYYDLRGNRTNVAGVISDIMTSETGINFYAVHQFNDVYSIVIPEALPWHMNEEEKQLTEEKAKEIFKKYFVELDFPHGTRDLSYLEIEL